MSYSTGVSRSNASIKHIFLLADQPWQTLVMREISIRLTKIRPDLQPVIVTTDYFTFIHGQGILLDVASRPEIILETQEDIYWSWQTKQNGDTCKLDIFLKSWEAENCSNRSLGAIEKTNQWVFGDERSFFYLPINSYWKKRILVDSIKHTERIVSEYSPIFMLSIERSTLLTNLLQTKASKLLIPFYSFIPSRINYSWLLRESLGRGISNQMLTDMNSLSPLEISQGRELIENLTVNKRGIYNSTQNEIRSSYSLRKERPVWTFLGDLRKLAGRIYDRFVRQRRVYAGRIVRLEQNLANLTILEIKKSVLFFSHSIGLTKCGITSPPQCQYFLWALHARPEGSVLVLGDALDEIEVLMEISAQIPKGKFLVVKENPEMYGLRSQNFYRDLAACNSVILADPFANTWNFIEQSSGVIGMSGTILLEGEFIGKKSLALGKPEFDKIISYCGIHDLNKFFTNSNGAGVYQPSEKVIRYVAQILKETRGLDFPTDDQEELGLSLEEIMCSERSILGIQDFVGRVIELLDSP